MGRHYYYNKKYLKEGVVLKHFDRNIFESIVDRVIVGGYDDKGERDPYLLTFVYRTGENRVIACERYRLPRRSICSNEKNEELCSNADDETEQLCSNCVEDRGRVRGAV